MSFSSNVKDELSRIIPEARHLRVAEIASIICHAGKIHSEGSEGRVLSVTTEHAGTARKYFTLLKKTYKIETKLSIRKNTRLNMNRSYTVSVRQEKDIRNILESTKLSETEDHSGCMPVLTENRVIAQSDSKRAFLRGAFLSSGSVSDPGKFYHLEIDCQTEEQAKQLQRVMLFFQLDAKITVRKKVHVVYLKESEQIAEALGVMGASSALMDLENIRIMKDMRNLVNRRVNCETANIGKTISAAMNQAEDIRIIKEKTGLEGLPENLREMAEARLKFPEATLEELGRSLKPAVGKSGVNHRLRKLTEIADRLRNG